MLPQRTELEKGTQSTRMLLPLVKESIAPRDRYPRRVETRSGSIERSEIEPGRPDGRGANSPRSHIEETAPPDRQGSKQPSITLAAPRQVVIARRDAERAAGIPFLANHPHADLAFVLFRQAIVPGLHTAAMEVTPFFGPSIGVGQHRGEGQLLAHGRCSLVGFKRLSRSVNSRASLRAIALVA